ncbi:restriction endonuclease [Streptomyces parvulus]|uniref:restriction endonuclease n=1 Tax=Streptomyces parvulus TaxID=146923 RepID=UPI0033BD6644
MHSHQAVPAKPWRDRSNSLGYIQGGTAAQAALLQQVLVQLPCDGKDALEWETSEGKHVSTRCEDLCRRVLSAPGLAERSGEAQWQPSTYAQQWLENRDNSFLAAHLHANVKFFGELLLAIGDQTKHADLLEAATETYGLNWTTLSPVRDRTGWLRSLGMVELWGQRVVRTELGDALLKVLPLCLPEPARGEEEQAATEPDAGEREQLAFFGDSLQLEQVDLRNRRALIGYIPRGNASENRDGDSTLTANAALRRLIALLGEGAGLDEFSELCSNEFGISKTSFTSMMHTLRHTGLVEQTSFNYFAPSEDAHRLVDEGNELLLAAYLHVRYLFFGEILLHLGAPATTSALVAVAKETYGYTQATNGEVRLRLAFLQDAGLVERVDWQRFRVTAAGRSLTKHLALQLPAEAESEEADSAAPQDARPSLPEAVIAQLRQHGNVGTDSREFEEAVGRAFAFLGFQAEHLGGSGRTDVLAIAQLAAKDQYRIIVDAKSSGNGQVAESSVKFDALRDHKRKHKADHVVVVGPEFAPRLKNWAVENEAILLRIEELATLLDRHWRNPMPLTELRDAFSRIDAFSDDLDERYQTLERRSLLMRRIIDLASQEALDEDPVDDGYISVENIIYALRKEFTPRPSRQEVDELIAFLSSPVVAALESTKGRHKLIDSPRNLALRLVGLGGTIATD